MGTVDDIRRNLPYLADGMPIFTVAEMRTVLEALDNALATAAVLHVAYNELKAIVANTSESDNP